MKTFKEFLNEAKYEVEVSVRDARKANDIAKDMFRGAYKNDGSNVFIFKSEDDMYEFADELDSAGIEMIEEATQPEWRVSFKKQKMNGISIDEKPVNVKARDTREAIVKAAKKLGVKDKSAAMQLKTKSVDKS